MLRQTGSAKVNEITSGSPITHALLYNFDFDGDTVKPEHLQWLNKNILPKAVMPQYKIWMRGTASQVGDPDYNLKLSKRRAQNVESYLVSMGVEKSRITTKWRGAYLSTSTNKDDERDRAVEIRLQGSVKQTLPSAPKPPPTPPAAPPVSDTFRMRVLGSAQVSKVIDLGKWMSRISKAAKLRKIPKVGMALDLMFLEIQDVKNSISAFYVYTGVGGGAGAFWLSSSHIGPWNRFTTSKPILVSEFDGPATFTTGGAWKFSLNFIGLYGTPSGVRSVFMSINTGVTVGAGVSSTGGACLFLESTKIGRQ